ncbi:MAG: protein-L-isoaspartate(D-aspartate) O-methyltransferase [Rhodospirillaceae bacterium]|jgi:protein-L-isoaspartate(D-aspartate) O-methyltransferase|nr:protein-L-isoaspartate(D-aspartate) O-methyltransferase [Rhodospirillaceae bacterium]MBT5455030.1 protein-L-isoaspartate(D-aspartate) O-methyltransferase [Rhodospirillaceae bacterium]
MTLEARKIRLVMELRQQGITDQTVLSAIERVPREAFVPESFQDQAYENTALPIGHGQTISQPAVVGFMTQALELGPRMKVLEIGTGCGYQAAVLAQLCRRVYTIERYRELLRDSEKRLQGLRISNVTTKWGDGHKGWPEQAPFDRIILTAASVEVPAALFEQLGDDGILIAPVGKSSYEQVLMRFRRVEGGWETDELWPVRFVPMVDGTVNGTEIAVEGSC